MNSIKIMLGMASDCKVFRQTSDMVQAVWTGPRYPLKHKFGSSIARACSRPPSDVAGSKQNLLIIPPC